jgi:uncharacterized protein YodC (DUF2158 family)
MEKKFKTGDVVRLNSDGPDGTKMTVEDYISKVTSVIPHIEEESSRVKCRYPENGEFKWAYFEQDMLSLAND